MHRLLRVLGCGVQVPLLAEVGLVRGALTTHAGVADVVGDGLGFLWNLAKAGTNLASLGATDLRPLLLRILQLHAGDAIIQQWAAELVTKL